MGLLKRAGQIVSDESGDSTLITTLISMVVILFLCFSIVPFFVFSMKHDKLNEVIDHALKEVEAVGYMSAAIRNNTNDRLAAVGIGQVVVDGDTYPDYSGSTVTPVLRTSADPTVQVSVKYPAPNISKMLLLLGGSGSTEDNEGFFSITVYGRSEAYD